uniref:Uncharacterized protein n=1 Tax=Megaselia scalaris TaxID=36166 RepID=T1GL60_MEGSC
MLYFAHPCDYWEDEPLLENYTTEGSEELKILTACAGILIIDGSPQCTIASIRDISASML